jgi:hypothetical protein
VSSHGCDVSPLRRSGRVEKGNARVFTIVAVIQGSAASDISNGKIRTSTFATLI